MIKLICFVGAMNAGGAETFLMKIYRAIDRNKYQFDFIVNTKEKCFYDDEIQLLGGHIFYSKPKSKALLANIIENYRIIKKNQYDAALRMTSHSLGTIDLLVAKIAGINKLILRSTNAGNTGSKTSYFLHKLFSFLPQCIPTVKIAPSELAAEYLFGKDCVKSGIVQIIHNGLPLDKFAFSESDRIITRKQLAVERNFVIGHIGRFNVQKNHCFIIDVFQKLYKKNNSARLLLIGSGELENQIKQQAEKLGLLDKVIFAGTRHDIPELLMAMDVFVLPSFFEGMPNVVIEAQATGLPCIVSDMVTKEVQITDLVIQLPLNINLWGDSIMRLDKHFNREIYNHILRNGAYDINKSVDEFVKTLNG